MPEVNISWCEPAEAFTIAAVIIKADEVITQKGCGAIEAHDIRTLSNGRVIFIGFHLVVPGDMTRGRMQI